MPKSTCSFDPCSKPVHSRGLCTGHYQQRSKGRPLTPLRPKRPKQPSGTLCSFDPCSKPVRSNGLCNGHNQQRWKGQPLTPLWVPGGHVSYSGAHQRIRDAKGSASSHDCIACGGPAKDWAYQYTDPDVQWELRPGGKKPSPYSLDPAHYEPMCASCHVQFDTAYAAN